MNGFRKYEIQKLSVVTTLKMKRAYGLFREPRPKMFALSSLKLIFLTNEKVF